MQYRLAAILSSFTILALGCAAPSPPSSDSNNDSGAKNSAPLHALFDEAWQHDLEENPLFATAVGVHTWNDRLPSQTAQDRRRRNDYRLDLLQRLDKIDRDTLSQTDRVSYALFERQLRGAIDAYGLKHYLFPFTADSGFHTGFARLANDMPFATVTDYENYIRRMEGWPDYVDQHIAILQEAIEIGMTQPRVVLAGYEVTMATHLVDKASDSVFYRPFEHFATTVPEEERDRLRQAGERAILGSIVPGYQKLLDFMVDTYLPNARETLGASELPNGEAYYRQRIRHFTTLDLTPEEIHQIGLEEVSRIRAEMDQVIEQVGFEGSFAEFLTFLRTDPRFYAKTPDELLMYASYIAKRMDGKLPAFFNRMPRLPYGVEPVPDHLAPKYTTGRYVSPALGSTEPGYYWVNTYKLEHRPLYTMEALTLHEAVPGHHFQGSLARELENLPKFRRFSYLSAFGEGWGLYSERLGLEAGFYTDPYSNFGRLTYEMWRACRLVVDTGIHAMGWSRQQAIDYLASNTALPLHEVTTETDRYISWPGQALSYKLGELKIRELRARSEEKLGTKFDLRAFHDKVLENGSVTLPILEELIDEWIEQQGTT